MSKASIRKKDPTDHHVVPRSLGGSDHEVNLMGGVNRKEHNKFHTWAFNKPPCFNIRFALLNAIGGDFCPQPESLENILQITTMPNWTKLYDANAFVPVAELGAHEKARKATEFQITFWKEEELLIRNLLHALLNGRDFPVNNPSGREFQTNMLISMESENVRDSLQQLMTQVHHKHRLRWVNPMHELTRESILRWVDSMPKKTDIDNPKEGAVRDAFERILKRQLESLESYIRERTEEKKRWASTNPYVIGGGQ